MAGLHGDFVARTVTQGRVSVGTGWTALVVSSTPLKSRRHIRIQVQGNLGKHVGLAYVSVNSDGTYTAPTTAAKLVTRMQGNSTWIEPLGDTVQLYGILLQKGGETDSSVPVIVTEYA